MQTVPELASSKLAQVHLYSAATRPRKTSSSLMMKQRLVISQKYLDKSHFFFLIVKKKKELVKNKPVREFINPRPIGNVMHHYHAV